MIDFKRAAAALLLASVAVSASAQGLTTSALKGLDNKAPIDVNADRIDVLDQQNLAVFSGNVHVRQAKLSLDADRVKVAYSRPAKGDPVIKRLDADGNVRLATSSEKATSRFGIYDVEKRVLTLIGNVVLEQGTTRVQGNRLTIDLASGRSTLDGQASTGQPGGRVSGRFAVPDRKQ